MAWTAPRTWVASEVVTASIGNTHWRDNLKMIGDAWEAYTPTLLNWTLGNGTLTGKRMLAGKWVRFSIELTLGSTSTTAGNLRFAAPATPRIATDLVPIGTAYLLDTSASARRLWVAAYTTVGGTGICPHDASGTGINATTPWTWATGDLVSINGEFESI